VTVRKLFPLAAAFGLWAAGPAPAQNKADTAAVQAANQKLADAVAEKLKAAGVAKGAKLNIETRGGVAELSGTATSEQQHEEILETLKKVPGLRRIESYVTVAGTGGPVQRAGGQQIQGGVGPVPGPGSPYSASPLPPGGPVPPGAVPVPTGDPLPLNGMPAMAPVDPAGPRLPPYAWPTYAPYNNYSRVAYPETYPYNAFPYIGPYYPFPRVPLGWRKVVLEWEDGHWYYGKLASPHDFWRVRFW
jgi:hypothetical protein